MLPKKKKSQFHKFTEHKAWVEKKTFLCPNVVNLHALLSSHAADDLSHKVSCMAGMKLQVWPTQQGVFLWIKCVSHHGLVNIKDITSFEIRICELMIYIVD